MAAAAVRSDVYGATGGVCNWHSCWRSNKLKLMAVFLLSLLLMQYLFGASIYNIRIFDYNIAQIYVWGDGIQQHQRLSGESADDDDPSWAANASSIVNNATVPSARSVSGARTFSVDNSTSMVDGRLNETVSGARTDASSIPAVIQPGSPGPGIGISTSMQLTSSANASNSSLPISSSNNSTTITSATSASPAVVVPTATTSIVNSATAALPQCPLLPPVLVGPIKIWFKYPSMAELAQLYPDLRAGGHYKPMNCVSRHRVAIIIPYRDRERHLRGFLHNLHSLLQKQQLDYVIYVVEQISNQTFNRAKLMNVGFVEALKHYDWQCVIFHDVDLLPEDDRNIYSCPQEPRHMSVAIDKFNYKLPYAGIFGGICAMTAEQFRTVNGFSNDYWGWGGEDDDMASRVRLANYRINRYPHEIARYKMIKHEHEKTNPVNSCRYNLMYKVKQRWKKDGLATLEYKLLAFDELKLYTRVYVDLLEEASLQRLKESKICATKTTS